MNNDESTKQDNRPSMQWYPDDWWAEMSLKLCSMAAQGLWRNILDMMFKAKPRGILPLIGYSNTMAKDGKTILLYSKQLAKILSQNEDDVLRWLNELINNQVCSIDANGCIYNRRMKREWERKEEISEKRAEAGKIGAKKRWKSDGKKMTKMAASSSTSFSSSTSHTPKKGVSKETDTVSDKTDIAPTKQMIGIFKELFSKYKEGKPKIDAGKDGNICKRLWAECKSNNADDPLAFWRQQCEKLIKEKDISTIGGISSWWNSAMSKKGGYLPKGWK